MSQSQDIAPGGAPAPSHRPLSFGEERFWLLDRLSPSSRAYTTLSMNRLRGRLDGARLARALEAVVARHEILRTTYPELEGRPSRRVHEAGAFPFSLEIEPAPDVARGEREAYVQTRAFRLEEEGFDLATGPLFRALLVRFTPDDHALTLAFHHILVDDWSIRLLYDDLAALYAADESGRPVELPPLPATYADYATQQRDALAPDGDTVGEPDWWAEALCGAPTSLAIPADRLRRPGPSEAGAVVAPVPKELVDGLKDLTAQHHMSLFMGGLAVYGALVARYARQDDLIIGTPFAGRDGSTLEPVVGYFLNTLPIRLRPRGDLGFRDFLNEVRGACLDAYMHRAVPFEKIVRAVNPPRSVDAEPLFRAMFALLTEPRSGPGLPGVQAEPLGKIPLHAKTDLMLSLQADGDGMACEIEYARDVFERRTVEGMAEALVTLWRALLENPDCRISELPLLDDASQERVVSRAEGPRTTEGEAYSLTTYFAARVEETPDAVAVIGEEGSLTYQALLDHARCVGLDLVTAGVQIGDRVAIATPRSTAFVIGVLGILHAGASYVPVDAADPRPRQQQLMQAAGVSAIVAPDGHFHPEVVGELPVVPVAPEKERDRARDVPLPRPVDAEAEAYLLYTSGSTGTPLGVRVPHRAIANLVLGQDYVETGPGRRFLLIARTSFDASTFELWAPLLTGGTLVVGPAALPTPAELGRILETHEISALWLSTAHVNQILDDRPETFSSLPHLLVGGEALSVAHMRRASDLLPNTRLTNVYGPTENTTFSTAWDLPRELPADLVSIPIGHPLANECAVVLDAAGRPVPDGVPGELHLGGAGLALGYLDAPEKTRDRFRTAQQGPLRGQRLYATGDLGRTRADGSIEFLGRKDREIKVLGHRVHPAETERALSEHATVLRAFVCRKTGPSGGRLVAYVVPHGGSRASASELRDFLAGRLPRHLVPSAFVLLPTLPLTPNGKVDEAALPPPEPETGERDGAEPASETEHVLAGIWSELLGVTHIARDLSFFEAGGDSLLVVRLAMRIEEQLGIEVSLRSIFDAPTVAGLARTLEREGGRRASGCHALNAVPGERPLYMMPLVTRHGLGYADLAARLPFPCRTIELPPAQSGREPLGSIEYLAAFCVARIREEKDAGPYRISGFSFGGLIAWEVASQLERRGETVERVVLLDALAPTYRPYHVLRRKWIAARIFLGWSNAERVAYLQRLWGRLRGREREAPAPRRLPGPGEDRAGWYGGEFVRDVTGRYEPPSLRADVLLVRARHQKHSQEILGIPRDAGWKGLTSGRFEFRLLDGDHMDVMGAEHREMVATILRESLSRGDRNTASPAPGQGGRS